MGKISLGRADSAIIKPASRVEVYEALTPVAPTIIETIKEVPVEVIKEIYINVIKEVQVPYEVRVEVPVEVIKEVQVPYETIKYIIKEVPVEVIKTHTVYDIESTMIEKQKVVALEKKNTKLQIALIIITLICVTLGVHNV